MSKFNLLRNNSSSTSSSESSLELSVNVCSSGYWPSHQPVAFHLPPELAKISASYQKFYLQEHAGHKLLWHVDKGGAEFEVHFSPKVKRSLVGTTYQMLLMMAFNGHKRLSCRQLHEITGVPISEFSHHLLSLAHPKVAVLLKKPNTKDLAEDHLFMINSKYFNKFLKVPIPLMQPPRTRASDQAAEAEAAREAELVEIQRRHQIDAAIVRIMKVKKKSKHSVLVGDVIAQLKSRFLPKPPLIKKRIEALIETEYLERDKQDRSVYNYLA